MLDKIKNRIEKSLSDHIEELDRIYSLNKISPLLFRNIKNFILRKAKRIRPRLFVISYLGYAERPDPTIYESSLSLELLHNFTLIHDDIIDNSRLRRRLPSMHTILNDHLKAHGKTKFGGKELAMIVGDIIYAMSINSLLSSRAKLIYKEKALKKLVEAALYTGGGEFLELLYSMQDIKNTAKEDIYKIYDLKTAYYSFAAPLSMGAILAGAGGAELKKLSKYGIYLGRAFQIKDDLLDIFGDGVSSGKGALTDLKESKKTLILWHAYNNSGLKDKQYVRMAMQKKRLNKGELSNIREIILSAGSVSYAKAEIFFLVNKAKKIGASLKMRLKYKNMLSCYSDELLMQPVEDLIKSIPAGTNKY